MIGDLNKEQILELLRNIGEMSDASLESFKQEHGLNIGESNYLDIFQGLSFFSIKKLLNKGPLKEEKKKYFVNIFHEQISDLSTSGLHVHIPYLDNVFITETIPAKYRVTGLGEVYTDLLIIEDRVSEWERLSPSDVFQKLKQEELIRLEFDVKKGGINWDLLSKDIADKLDDIIGLKEDSFEVMDVSSQLVLKRYSDRLAIFINDYGNEFIQRKLENNCLVPVHFEAPALSSRGSREGTRDFNLVRICDNADPVNIELAENKAKEVKDFINYIMGSPSKDFAYSLAEKIGAASSLIYLNSRPAGITEENLRQEIDVISTYFNRD